MVDLIEKRCAFCGKEFYPTPDHAYIIGRRGHGAKYFCKYTCMCRYREKPRPSQKRKYKKRDVME